MKELGDTLYGLRDVKRQQPMQRERNGSAHPREKLVEGRIKSSKSHVGPNASRMKGVDLYVLFLDVKLQLDARGGANKGGSASAEQRISRRARFWTSTLTWRQSTPSQRASIHYQPGRRYCTGRGEPRSKRRERGNSLDHSARVPVPHVI